MLFNKKIAAIALVAATTAPAMAFAASANTINFQGEVTTQTCAVTVNGNAANPTVLLPTVSTASLAATGSNAGMTTFTIGVTGCTAQASATPIKTVFVGNQVDGNGNLGNTGTATNVALQLLDPTATSTPFNLSGATGYAAAGLNLAAGATAATHDFAVRYYSATGNATAGSVLGSVQYAVSYQ
ncbi:fimbrial protein [Paraburkholderia sp. JHI2823]|uniref:fimbrial protein n=1 Tax=Paraburkholderia sp. JHI2823 TaxID=3112960 RepID=UPI003182A0B4